MQEARQATTSFFTHLTPDQSNITKGVGILMIVLHNFYHNLTPKFGENEFSFRPDVLGNYWSLLVASPESAFLVLFSYLGHYGVQIFVFFNAYGIYRKYDGVIPDALKFIKGIVSKIYMTFLFCLVIYVTVGLIKEHIFGGEQLICWSSILWKVLLVSNLIPHAGLTPVGPWWYVPFVIQLYLLLPMILIGFKRFGGGFLFALTVLALTIELASGEYLKSQGLNINFTIIGHMSVICFGIWLASRKSAVISARWVFVGLLMFVLGNVNRYLWVVSDLSFTVLALAVASAAFSSTFEMPLLSRCLAFYGGLSLHLFLVNGFLRGPFHGIAETHHQWWVNNAMAVSSLLFATACAFAFSRLDSILRRNALKAPLVDRQ